MLIFKECQIDLVTSRCPCCHLQTRPELKENEPFLLGPRLEGFINLLMGQFFLTKFKIKNHDCLDHGF
ncbi:hypothetical protein DB41_GC00270 [Neochlamydia sp. TUME1]|nr:hypothetical protein DB41_GC00270 [Neochlamydia sp. TUME1]